MKKIIFIDNETKEISEGWGDLEAVTDFLDNNGFFNFFKEDEIIPIYNFYHDIDKEKAYELLFDDSNIICTYSMYTGTHYNSLYQLFNFLSVAGRNEIENKCYIDCSGQIIKTLNNNLRDFKDSKDTLSTLSAIATNYILTNINGELKRVIVKFKGYYEDFIYFEDFDIKQLTI